MPPQNHFSRPIPEIAYRCTLAVPLWQEGMPLPTLRDCECTQLYRLFTFTFYSHARPGGGVQVHAGQLQEECQEMDVNRMPYFRLYLRGELVAEFSANLASINDVRRALEALKRGEAAATAAGAAPAQSALSAAELLSVDDGTMEGVDAAELEAAAALGGSGTIDTMVLDGVDAIAGGMGSHPLGLPTHRS